MINDYILLIIKRPLGCNIFQRDSSIADIFSQTPKLHVTTVPPSFTDHGQLESSSQETRPSQALRAGTERHWWQEACQGVQVLPHQARSSHGAAGC